MNSTTIIHDSAKPAPATAQHTESTTRSERPPLPSQVDQVGDGARPALIQIGPTDV